MYLATGEVLYRHGKYMGVPGFDPTERIAKSFESRSANSNAVAVSIDTGLFRIMVI